MKPLSMEHSQKDEGESIGTNREVVEISNAIHSS